MHEDIIESVDRRELTDLLRELVRIPSINPPGSEDAVASVLDKRFRDLGFEVQSFPSHRGRANLLGLLKRARRPPPPLLLPNRARR
jgi:acetylornithine deacetylase/succinyl-diaminopimelate desuccinylase-like protein